MQMKLGRTSFEWFGLLHVVQQQIGDGLGQEIRTGLRDFRIAWECSYYVIMQLKEADGDVSTGQQDY